MSSMLGVLLPFSTVFQRVNKGATLRKAVSPYGRLRLWVGAKSFESQRLPRKCASGEQKLGRSVLLFRHS